MLSTDAETDADADADAEEAVTGADGAGPGAPASSRAPGPHRRRRLVIAVALVAALVSAGGMIASTAVKSPAQVAADAGAPKASVLTSPVVRRVLADTTVLRGTFATGQQYPVLPTSVAPTSDGPGGGALVVTALKAGAGQSVNPGQVLAEVSGRPVVALPGKVPTYRDLAPGDTGTDIAQLQTYLHNQGISTHGDRTGYFGSGTKQAVTAWYGALGYAVPTTAETAATAVQTAQAAVDQQQQTVTDLRAQIASGSSSSSTGSGSGSTATTAKGTVATSGTSAAASPSAVADPGGASLSVQLSRARTALAQAERALAQAESQSGPEVPSSEVLFLPSFPARVDSVSAHVGDHVTTPLMSLTAGGLNLTGHLLPSDAALVKVGMKVTVLDESTGRQYGGRVGSVSPQVNPTAQQATTSGASQQAAPAGSGGDPYVPVTVTPDTSWDPRLAGQDVRITIVAASTAGEVLAVPAAAISSAVDGRTSVTVLAADGSRRTVTVNPGVTADNYVQVTPSGGVLKPGDQVVVGK